MSTRVQDAILAALLTSSSSASMKTVSEIATDKLAVSADEVERWIRSEGAKQDQARAHRSGKPVAAASETDAASSKDEEIHDQNEDDDDMWVACDACLKWRRIEKSTWTSHVASQMEASAEAAASTAAAASPSIYCGT